MNASFHVVKQMFLLSFNDFNKKMSGSYFGFFWLLANPLITIILYWFVFQIGFKSSNTTEGIPFVPWLICGMVPWFYFSEALSSATSCFFEYSYLVKKVVFRIGMLPIVKVISAIFIHLFFLIFTIIIVIFYDIYPELYILQLIYYIFCLLFLLTGLSLLTSSIVPFFKDLSQIVSIALQLGFLDYTNCLVIRCIAR